MARPRRHGRAATRTNFERMAGRRRDAATARRAEISGRGCTPCGRRALLGRSGDRQQSLTSVSSSPRPIRVRPRPPESSGALSKVSAVRHRASSFSSKVVMRASRKYLGEATSCMASLGCSTTATGLIPSAVNAVPTQPGSGCWPCPLDDGHYSLETRSVREEKAVRLPALIYNSMWSGARAARVWMMTETQKTAQRLFFTAMILIEMLSEQAHACRN